VEIDEAELIEWSSLDKVGELEELDMLAGLRADVIMSSAARSLMDVLLEEDICKAEEVSKVVIMSPVAEDTNSSVGDTQ